MRRIREEMEKRRASVLELNAKGLNDVEIARRLGIGHSAVGRMRRKLGLPPRSNLPNPYGWKARNGVQKTREAPEAEGSKEAQSIAGNHESGWTVEVRDPEVGESRREADGGASTISVVGSVGLQPISTDPICYWASRDGDDMSNYRHGAKVDRNQKAIVDGLRDYGCSVEEIKGRKKGTPDLLVGFMGMNLLIEVKPDVPDKRERNLKPDQVEWHFRWKGQVEVAHDLREAIVIVEHARKKKLATYEQSEMEKESAAFCRELRMGAGTAQEGEGDS